MSVIHIQGPGCLKGTIEIQGSKNAVLPVMAASLLHRGITVLRNVPKIQDVYSMMEILEYLGCELKLEGHSLTIDAGKASGMPVPAEMAGKMRSSIMLLGPMLGRFREAVTSLPGGCCLGKRPVNLHLDGLRRLGADIREEGNQIAASAAVLEGASFHLDYPSVGATENLIMAAAAIIVSLAFFKEGRIAMEAIQIPAAFIFLIILFISRKWKMNPIALMMLSGVVGILFYQ